MLRTRGAAVAAGIVLAVVLALAVGVAGGALVRRPGVPDTLEA